MANLTALRARVSLRVHAMEHSPRDRDDDGLETDPQAVLEHELYRLRCENDRLRAALTESVREQLRPLRQALRSTA